MLSILILVLATTASSAKDYRPAFEAAYAKFSAKDGLLQSEPPAVHLQRYECFCKFAKTVDDVNANNELTFSAENNFLSILSDEEKKSYMGLNLTGHFHEVKTNKPKSLTVGEVAETRDFSKKIGPIKDQGSCGSCWTFAATAALEGEIYFTNSIEDVSLSEQEYMECSTTSHGCRGGWMEWCYDYSKGSGRIAPSTAYPYEAKDTRRCRASGKANALVDTNTKVTGNIEFSGDDELLQYASEHIVSVAIKVVSTFHGYKKGIFNDRSCNQEQVDHAVAVVGYESDYWLVRNSWGAGWGDDGYIKMSRKINNICHISAYSSIPRVECRDNSCTAPVIDNDDGGDDESDGGDDESDGGDDESDGGDDESDGGDDNDDGSDKQDLCKIKVELGKCNKKETLARKECENNKIPEFECVVTKVKKCYYTNSKDKDGKNFVEYYGPCKVCDANAGLVMCNDCNCCIHKHMCDNPA